MKLYLLKRNDGSECLMRIFREDATVEGELAKWPEEQRKAIVSHEEIPAETYPEKRREIFKP